jgi:hypothetical protein
MCDSKMIAAGRGLRIDWCVHAPMQADQFPSAFAYKGALCALGGLQGLMKHPG